MNRLLGLGIIVFSLWGSVRAQVIERARPAEWNDLINGGRFMDLFRPIAPLGALTTNTWGAENVIPRYVDNGIEDAEWSYWGGNALLGDDGQYHLMVCRWREDSVKGHNEWSNSIVVHAVSENSFGPYKVMETIGPGHNPEIFRLKDGRYVVYVIDGRYVAESLEGPWEYGKFEFDQRDRPIIEGLSNLSFAQREDGSYIMVCRGGGIWFSKDGLSPYNQVTEKSVYPPVEGHFEDPVIWRDNIQYHMIVNDWLGRIAYYLRSKDGVNWKIDAGEAYLPGITRYTDGTNEDWFKYERIKVLQDNLGRATQAHFAVIDVLKKDDKGSDNHSSKNITIPLTVGRKIKVLNEAKIKRSTKSIKLRVEAEEGFDPNSDIDINSLRFGASEEVNFGRGSKVKKIKIDGPDLLVTFSGEGNGITEGNFVGKLLGKTNNGKLLFGYARLPGVDYIEPILSALIPEITKDGMLKTEVSNFGQVISKPAKIKIERQENSIWREIASGTVPKLDPFEKFDIKLSTKAGLNLEQEQKIKVSIYSNDFDPVVLIGNMPIDK
ncbi:glycoside hydrolase family protein [Arenibacter certesii]|uniref:glycoside hydrolase family protein n=1 Tax=Arenibacter certesii TaxID=228955 RepID=UPI0012FB260D|nr:glycoside hydrolase family protein [Arenibacter certesii]